MNFKNKEIGGFLLPELSIFLPCYNEAENVGDTVRKIIPVLKKITNKWEIVMVNDGSKDNTLEELKKLVRRYGKNFKIVNHSVNRGYGAAFKSGLYNSRYQWRVLMDVDGQFDFRDVYKLIGKQRETKADLVIGYYLERKVPFYRIWGSKLWELAVFILFSLRVRDIDCGFKLINKEVPDTIPKLEAERGPFINSEFLIKAKKAGFKIAEVGVNHFERRAGKATGASLNVILSGLTDLIRLWFKINFAVPKISNS